MKKLPFLEVVESQELEKRTGLKITESRPWGVAVLKASRQFPWLDTPRVSRFFRTGYITRGWTVSNLRLWQVSRQVSSLYIGEGFFPCCHGDSQNRISRYE